MDEWDEIFPVVQSQTVERDTHAEIDLIFGAEGIIKSMKADYVPRPSQIESAHMVLDALKFTRNMLLEGPCGFGKTLAYLVPIFDHLYNDGEHKTAVIVTNGISLQEQLFYKDIPLIQRIFRNIYSRDIKFALLKGKQNFICMKKMAENMATKMFDMGEGQKIKQWYENTKEGDLSELTFVPDHTLIKEVTCSVEGECKGRKCKLYESCFYQTHKAKAGSSNIIITNYHLLFSDMNIGGSVILPHYDIIVFDEAHEMPDVFRDFYVQKLSLKRVSEAYSDFGKLKENSKIPSYYIREADEYSLGVKFKELIKDLEIYFLAIYRSIFKDNKYLESKNINGLFTLPSIDHLHVHISEVLTIMNGIAESISDELEVEKTNETLYSYHNGITRIISRLFEMEDLLTKSNEDFHNPKNVYWIDKDEENTHNSKPEQRVSINVKPVIVGEHLKRVFHDREGLTCIYTSATLSVGQNFSYIKAELGLDLCLQPPMEYIGESPFNLSEQQLWYLPSNAIEGNNKEFERLSPTLIGEIISACKGGVLVLFTSIRNMNDAYYILRNSFKSIKILKQGDKPKVKLIEEFTENKDSVLLATKSFFTGIDVPGEALRCVVIDKLPFPIAGDPVMIKLESISDNAFFKYCIPSMIITLKQAVGRGVRSINDNCVIAILDNRLKTAKYKKKINDSFNYNKRTTQDVKELSKYLFPEDYK